MPVRRFDDVERRLREDPEYHAAREELSPYEELARRLIAFRIEQGLTQKQLAVRCSTTQSAIARLESGEHEPRVDTLRKVARAMGGELLLEFKPARRKAQLLARLS